MKQCIDPKLNNEFPPKAIAKVYIKTCHLPTIRYMMTFLNFQMAAVAALCVQYEADFRPNMTIVVKALQPLINAKLPQQQSQS